MTNHLSVTVIKMMKIGGKTAVFLPSSPTFLLNSLDLVRRDRQNFVKKDTLGKLECYGLTGADKIENMKILTIIETNHM